MSHATASTAATTTETSRSQQRQDGSHRRDPAMAVAGKGASAASPAARRRGRGMVAAVATFRQHFGVVARRGDLRGGDAVLRRGMDGGVHSDVGQGCFAPLCDKGPSLTYTRAGMPTARRTGTDYRTWSYSRSDTWRAVPRWWRAQVDWEVWSWQQ